MINRYNITGAFDYDKDDFCIDEQQCDDGTWVKYEDIKHLLQNPSSNSDYASLKDALESIADCGGGLTGEDAQEMKQIAVEALQYSAKE